MPRSRGPFNTTMSLFTQVGGLVSLLPYAIGVPCRFVRQDQITPGFFPFDQRQFWVTYDAVAPVAPSYLAVGSVVTASFGDADVFEIASFPGTQWYQLGVEIVQPFGEPTYLRTWLGPRWYP